MISKKMNYLKSTFFLLMIGFLMQNIASASIDSPKNYKVYVFDIKEEIAPPVWRRTQLAFKEAKKLKADIILIHMNTYGGQLDIADSIRTLIMYSKIPVYVFIDNNAASAGALISIACDSIYMRKGANIGAATVVDQSGTPMPDKYQSYMRSLMRSTAKSSGRNPQIAQAMVDPSIKIEGITDTNKILTFTADEAIKYGFCEGTAETIQDVMQNASIKNYEIVEQNLSVLDKLIGFLINPIVSGILIIMIIGGIYFEVQAPGIGLPLGIAITGALLYFAPLYIEGLANHWEILLFIVGLILIVLEIFVIPGFGVTGVSGIILVIAGLILSMLNNVGFDFTYTTSNQLIVAFSVVLIAMFVGLITSFFLGQKLITSNRFTELSLQDIQESSKGFTVVKEETKNLLGQQGITQTIMRPTGRIIIDNNVFQATALTGYIDKDQQVKVVDIIHNQLVVEKV